jgi:catechol 2,3-dioxygenase-like lactoylglutathione lyase family enzyme
VPSASLSPSASPLHSASRWRCRTRWCGRLILVSVGIRLGSTVINCADLEVMTGFWSQALGLTPSAGNDFRVLRGDAGTLSLQRADTPVTARDQMHLDLYSDDQAGQVERLTGLGASYVRHHQESDDDYVVMTDPEGNEFCVVAVASL